MFCNSVFDEIWEKQVIDMDLNKYGTRSAKVTEAIRKMSSRGLKVELEPGSDIATFFKEGKKIKEEKLPELVMVLDAPPWFSPIFLPCGGFNVGERCERKYHKRYLITIFVSEAREWLEEYYKAQLSLIKSLEEKENAKE